MSAIMNLSPEDLIRTNLPDNSTHTHRFEIMSQTSDKIYIVAKNRKTGKWVCSCPGHIFHKGKQCKHLQALMPFLKEMEENKKIVG